MKRHSWVSARLGSRAAIMIAGLALVAAAPAAASAAPTSFNAGDGTQTGGDCSTTLDWYCSTVLSNLVTASPSVATSGKEDQPGTWTTSGGSGGTSKGDILGAWSYSYTDSSNNDDLALAFNRATGSGASYVGFELNQAKDSQTSTTSSGMVVGCRTDGDLLVSYNFGGSGTPNITVSSWTWDAKSFTGSDPCASSTATGSFSTPVALSSDQASTNTGPIDNYLPPTAPSTFQPQTFGEAAVNVSAAVAAVTPATNVSACEYFQSVHLTSRSSNPTSADLVSYADGGQIVAWGCSTTTTTTTCAVSITSPPSGTTEYSSSFTVGGTSSGADHIILDDGGSPVAQGTPGAGGDWSIPLTNVSAGSHSYTALVPGCTSGSSAATVSSPITVTVDPGGKNNNGSSFGPGPNTSTSTNTSSNTSSGSGSGSASNANGGYAVACPANRLAITDIFPQGRRVHILGIALPGMAGKRVQLIASWNGKVVTTMLVRKDLSFSTFVALPPAKVRGHATYWVRSGTLKSAHAAYTRRLYNTYVHYHNGRIRFSGTVVSPLTKPATMITIVGASSCKGIGHGVKLAKVRVARNGRFTASFVVPKSMRGLHFVFLQTRTTVLRPGRSHRKLSVSGITRAVGLFG